MAGRHLTEADVRTLAEIGDPGRPLGFAYLCDLEEDPSWRATSFVVRVRAGGFLVALPADARVQDHLLRLSELEDDAVFYREASIAGETPRRRPVGEVAMFLADIPWRHVVFFRKVVSGRAAAPELVPMTHNGNTVRPVRAAMEAAVETWIGEVVDDPALAEYITAESAAPSERGSDGRASTRGPPAAAPPGGDTHEQLLARIRELEARLPSSTGVPLQVAAPGGRRGARGLFDDVGGVDGAALTAADWGALRAAAGPAPRRMAGHERAPRPEEADLQDAQLAEVEAGAIEDGLAEPLGSSADLQRLILAQTQVLAKLAQPRTGDPLTMALSNMSKEENFLGAKGSAARDAFVRVLSDDRATALAVRRAGAEAMGVPLDQVPSNMMLDYVERKMPVGDQKLLAMIASFAASGWRVAREENNTGLESWMAKLLVFTDQASVEGGRTQLAWMLTGLSDPNFSSMSRRRQGIKQFGKLIPSTWMSANVAYIKELDFLGSRMSGTSSTYDGGLADPPSKPPPADENHAAPKKPPRRPPRKPKGPGAEAS